jgi:hypothetical protein
LEVYLFFQVFSSLRVQKNHESLHLVKVRMVEDLLIRLYFLDRVNELAFAN